MGINPFDDADGSFSVLVTGWRVVYGEADRAARLHYIEQNWSNIRPKSLRDRLAEDRDFDQ